MSQFLISVSSSIIGSFVFLFVVLWLFKPKLKIGSNICKNKYSSTDPKDYYHFKFINKSIFSAYDIRIELLEVDNIPVPNGINNRYNTLTVVLNQIPHIPGYRPSWIRRNAPYALIFRTGEDLEKILSDEHKAIKVQISLRHGLTGLVKVHSKLFTEINQIKMGSFTYGKKLTCRN